MSTDSGQPGGTRPSWGDLFDDAEPHEAPEAEPQPALAPAPVLPAPAALDPEPEAEAEPDSEAAAPEREPVAEYVPPLPDASRPDPDPAPAPAAVRAAAPVAVGRLYRSAGAEGPATAGAIPAIDPEYLARREGAAPAAEPAAAQPAAPPRREGHVQGSGAGLTWTGVTVVVVAATVLVGFADALINNSLGIITGLALLISSVYCAIVVRRSDIWSAVITPPLAFLAAALTAGQLTLDSAGSLVIREGYMLLKTLAQSAPWIIGTTLICLVIVLVRRSRSGAPAHA